MNKWVIEYVVITEERCMYKEKEREKKGKKV